MSLRCSRISLRRMSALKWLRARFAHHRPVIKRNRAIAHGQSSSGNTIGTWTAPYGLGRWLAGRRCRTERRHGYALALNVGSRLHHEVDRRGVVIVWVRRKYLALSPAVNQIDSADWHQHAVEHGAGHEPRRPSAKTASNGSAQHCVRQMHKLRA